MMTPLQLFAAVGVPLIVVAIGGAVVLLNDWNIKRHRRMHPGE